MPATLERIASPLYICRAGEDHQEYGDAFSFVCTVKDMGGGVARICGACGTEYHVNTELWINEVLVAHGFTSVEYERIKNGRKRVIRRRLRNGDDCAVTKRRLWGSREGES